MARSTALAFYIVCIAAKRAKAASFSVLLAQTGHRIGKKPHAKAERESLRGDATLNVRFASKATLEVNGDGLKRVETASPINQAKAALRVHALVLYLARLFDDRRPTLDVFADKCGELGGGIADRRCPLVSELFAQFGIAQR